MSLLEFPEIAEIEDGQVLGASQLNTYQRACDYLLGKSHATYALGFGTGTYSGGSGNTYIDTCYLHCYHDKNTLFYAFQARCEVTPGSGPWHVSIQVYNDSDTWEEIVHESASNQTWDFIEGTADLSGNANLTAGQTYRWRILIKSEFADAFFRLYGMGEQEDISGWVTPPTYTNTNTSAQADFNDVRTDLRALNTMLPPIADMGNMGYGLAKDYLDVGANSEEEYIVAGYRYRPETILANIRLKTEMFRGADYDAFWKWLIYIRDGDGNEAEIYDSGWSEENTAYKEAGGYEWQTLQEIDLTAGTAATNIANAGITLTMGDWYQIIIAVAKDDTTTGNIRAKGGFLARQSDLTASAGWPSFTTWSVGDDDIGNARLTKFSDALGELYTGGGEELWGQHRAVGDASNSAGASWGFYGVHSKRWLVYHEAVDAHIYYGANFSEDYKLTDVEAYTSIDLTEIGIPWGGVYIVIGTHSAWEVDTAYG